VFRRSKYPLEAWLEASTRGATPGGIAARVRRIAGGLVQEVCLPKEPIPYYVHAQVELAGREPQFLAQTRRTPTEVRERYRFEPPCVLFVYKWTEARHVTPALAAAGDLGDQSVVYVCASEAQLARAKEVVAALSPAPPPRPWAAPLAGPRAPPHPPRAGRPEPEPPLPPGTVPFRAAFRMWLAAPGCGVLGDASVRAADRHRRAGPGHGRGAGGSSVRPSLVRSCRRLH
jgi:hypothetical protein